MQCCHLKHASKIQMVALRKAQQAELCSEALPQAVCKSRLHSVYCLFLLARHVPGLVSCQGCLYTLLSPFCWRLLAFLEWHLLILLQDGTLLRERDDLQGLTENLQLARGRLTYCSVGFRLSIRVQDWEQHSITWCGLDLWAREGKG